MKLEGLLALRALRDVYGFMALVCGSWLSQSLGTNSLPLCDCDLFIKCYLGVHWNRGCCFSSQCLSVDPGQKEAGERRAGDARTSLLLDWTASAGLSLGGSTSQNTHLVFNLLCTLKEFCSYIEILCCNFFV